MMVIFLVGLVSMILMRTLRKDYARYSKEEDGDDMVTFVFVSVNLPTVVLCLTCELALVSRRRAEYFVRFMCSCVALSVE